MPAGTIVNSGALVSPGGQQGIPGPNAVSTDPGNQATFGSDSKIYVPDPTPVITMVRLRTFSAVGNPSFEVDQRTCHAGLGNPATGAFLCDRWNYVKSGTMTINASSSIGPIFLPSPYFCISANYFNVVLATQETTLAAGDYLQITQAIEGPMLRELLGNPTSLSLLVASSVAGLKFSVTLLDSSSAYSLCNLCTIPSASTWTLIQLPNLPVWTASGNFPVAPGGVGYYLRITLACGTTYTAPSAGVWNSGLFVAAPGTSNFAASPVNSTFSIAFIQHEPGPLCTTLQDKPFSVNYDECLRYYQKTYLYGTAPGTATTAGCINFYQLASLSPTNPIRYIKPMAKVPTTTIYSTATGASGNVRDYTAGADKAITGINNNGDAGYSGVAVSSPNASNWNVAWQHTADTGW